MSVHTTITGQHIPLFALIPAFTKCVEKSQMKSWYRGLWQGYKLTVCQLVIEIYSTANGVSRTALIKFPFSVLLKCQADLKFVYLFCQNDNESKLLFFSYCRHPLVWPTTSNYVEHKNWNISLNTEICWLPHTPRINDCICLIEFVLRSIYIDDGNRFMLSTEITKGWKPEVDIDDVKFGTGSDN